MNSILTTGITIGAVDYGERDKIITVLTIGGEKIAMRARGINAPKAKLKFAGELFSLCEFEHTTSKNPLLITATPKHMFWGIRESVEKLYLACFPLEHISETAEDFKYLLACLSFLEVHEHSGKMAVKYLLECVKHMGIGFSVHDCVACGCTLWKNFAFDFDRGGFVCESCGGNQKGALLKTFQLTNDMDMENLAKINFTKSQVNEMLNLLITHAEIRMGKESKSLRGFMLCENPD